jgi:hypothetical protein
VGALYRAGVNWVFSLVIASQYSLHVQQATGLDSSRTSWDPIGVLMTVGSVRSRSGA